MQFIVLGYIFLIKFIFVNMGSCVGNIEEAE